MIRADVTDAAVARVLAQSPAFHRWQNRPLPRHLRQVVQELDEQALMSLVALAVQRLTADGPGTAAPRRLPR